MRGIHLISNGRLTEQDLQLVPEIIEHIDFIHLREKTKTAKEILQMIDFLLDTGVPADRIIINDRADVAWVKKCRGVQLAFHSIPVADVKHSFPKISIGKSVHSMDEAIAAEQNGADFLLYGHIFSSNSKLGVTPRGIPALKNVTENVSLPVIAIGGITEQNSSEVIGAGASGVAIMSGVWDAEDPTVALKRYRKVFDKRKEEHLD
ncbi:thiazole tautomerase (transcriptional regulator TenI) [Gracilibacillus orientalis]|uniref:Thiazole tautomerase (Transcriptional regulator TenI) n=1 Tax=Gracilibacillus orientalis TaxID=334253 RepID=A0A1I4HEH7_9BACI|nr:thiazole tautomerase TenI [Gracilibacillus orientalis]SFL40150.1 thiazole tautomerase (transcriptional regulator TenI) [Gracilibacillus orientalis]